MPRYDQLYSILATRSVDQGTVDVQTFIQTQLATGASPESIAEDLINDLENDGPIFGKFLRSITGAANTAVMTAARQGELVGSISNEAALQRMFRISRQEGSVAEALAARTPVGGTPTITADTDLDDHFRNALQNADPESAGVIEDLVLGEQTFMWIAELKKTCHRCLPLHGRKDKLADFKARGTLPENIHSGWDSSCHCRLVPIDLAEGVEELRAPLRRVPIEKGNKRTQRAVMEKDVVAAQDARDKALESLEGRRMLRRLGEANI